ncbi:MAG: TolC family protein [Flavobacteriales bacterium]|nr:TolC family protein [Flavobacteriales bacterium]
MKKLSQIVFILISVSATAQNSSQNVLSIDTFLTIVKKHHPLAMQANLKVKEGKAVLQNARGQFDPELFTNVDQKNFSDQQYFSILNAGISIPTWLGLDFYSSYQNNTGLYLNAENNLPQDGIWQTGISLPIGQGLFFDQRRNMLQQAKVYKYATEAEQVLMLNKLLLNAGNAYWNWFASYNNNLILEDAYIVNQQRLNAVKASAEFGDRPFIDTLEAAIQVQERLINLEQGKLDFRNKTLSLSTFLWLNENIPLEVNPETVPPDYSIVATQNESFFIDLNTIDSISKLHPEVLIYTFQKDQLTYDKKWKQEQLKPIINLNYNALSSYSETNSLSDYNLDNYKWGLTFAMPIFLRTERGALQLAKLKIQSATYDLQNKTNEVQNLIEASTNEYLTLQNQIKTYSQTVKYYEALLSAENTMFFSGESSLFLVNTRETNTISAKIKLIDFISKYKKAFLAINYNLGILNDLTP